MLHTIYTLLLSTDEDGNFRARISELPEVDAAGDTAEAALSRVEDEVLLALMRRMSAHRDIPEGHGAPDTGRTVALPLLATLKLALYREMRGAGVRKIDLARRLGWHPPQIDRLLDLTHASRLDQIEAGFRALGRSLEFAVTGDSADAEPAAPEPAGA